MGSPECVGCPECGTTLAESPDGHDTPVEHDWREEWTIDKETGERGKERICLRCYKREAIAIESDSTGRARERCNCGHNRADHYGERGSEVGARCYGTVVCSCEGYESFASLPPAPPTLSDVARVRRRYSLEGGGFDPDVVALCDEVRALRAEVAAHVVEQRAADYLAGACSRYVHRGWLDARCEIGDALLDYGSTRHGDANPIGCVDATYNTLRAARSSAAGEDDLKIGGMTVKTDPDMPPGEARIVDSRTGKVLARIVGVQSRSAAGEDTNG